MSHSSIKIDVVIPTHNAGPYLRDAVDSVLAQAYDNFTCIVFDNNSTDGSLMFLQQAEYDEVEVYGVAENLTMATSWTRAVSCGRAPFVKLLPADDLLDPLCLAREAQAIFGAALLRLDYDVVAVFSSRTIFGNIRFSGFSRQISDWGARRNRRLISSIAQPLHSYGRNWVYALTPGVFLEMALRAGGNFLGEPGSALMSRKHLTACLPWSDCEPYALDLDMWWRLAGKGLIVVCDDTNALFRIHGGQATRLLRSVQYSHVVSWAHRACASIQVLPSQARWLVFKARILRNVVLRSIVCQIFAEKGQLSTVEEN